MTRIKIINHSNHKLPEYQTTGSSGMDLHANISDEIVIAAGERVLIPTGISIELPDGFEAQIRPRSGLALKHGITVLNSPGTIDADYRGEIKVLLINHSKNTFIVVNGDRIAQMIISKFEKVEWDLANELEKTERNDGGYGHTGGKKI